MQSYRRMLRGHQPATITTKPLFPLLIGSFPNVWSSTDIWWSLKLPLSLGSILVWNQTFQIMCESRLDSRVRLPSSQCSRILLLSPGSLMGKPFGLTYSFLSGVQKPGGPLPRHNSFANSPQHHLKRTKKGNPSSCHCRKVNILFRFV